MNFISIMEKFDIKWLDFIDRTRYEKIAEAFLYRNPLVESKPAAVPSTHALIQLYSLNPGENYLFDQKPIAMGFTAYIGHDEVEPGHNSLKSNLKVGNGFYTEDYYSNYTSDCFKFFCQKNDIVPRPLKGLDLELSFYTIHFDKESKKLKASKKFYTECKNEEDRKLKELLKDYASAYLEILKKKLNELAPQGIQGIEPDSSNKAGNNQKELSALVKEIVRKEMPGILEPPKAEPPIRGIRGLADFLGISPGAAQKLKNKKVID